MIAAMDMVLIQNIPFGLVVSYFHLGRNNSNIVYRFDKKVPDV